MTIVACGMPSISQLSRLSARIRNHRLEAGHNSSSDLHHAVHQQAGSRFETATDVPVDLRQYGLARSAPRASASLNHGLNTLRPIEHTTTSPPCFLSIEETLQARNHQTHSLQTRGPLLLSRYLLIDAQYRVLVWNLLHQNYNLHIEFQPRSFTPWLSAGTVPLLFKAFEDQGCVCAPKSKTVR